MAICCYATHMFRQTHITHMTMDSPTSGTNSAVDIGVVVSDDVTCLQKLHMFSCFSIIVRRLLSTMPWTSFGSFCRKSPTFSSTRQSSSHLGSVNLGHVSKVVGHVRLGTSEWDCVVNKDQRNAIPTWGLILRIWRWCHVMSLLIWSTKMRIWSDIAG